MSDLRALLGDKYDDVIEKASRAYIMSYEDGADIWPKLVEFADSDRPDGDEDEYYSRVIVAETRRDMAATLAAVLPDLLAEASALRTERDALAERVRALADRIDRHTEVEPDPAMFRDADTGVWWEVSDAIRATLDAEDENDHASGAKS